MCKYGTSAMRMFNTATGTVDELIPRRAGEVAMYICGPTVYGEPHVGHGRTSLVYDILRRYLNARGIRVRHVSNITDIEDKIIARANAEGRQWNEIARECEAQWWQAMDALGILRPDDIPHATDYLEEMLELIGDLVDRDLAYETGDGVYLAVESVKDYGLLAHRSLAEMLASAESRIEAREDKRSPADFALWKKAKPGEPKWPSRFGEGRPGWHTECVAMSLKLLGEDFEVHGGGRDLVFPHHENERAQAVALDCRFARHWVHGGLVEVGGEKMSKSLGNFMTLRELLEQNDARSYRLLVLRAHYRSAIEVTNETLADAKGALDRIDACARRFAGEPGDRSTVESETLTERFFSFMDDDLDTPHAVAALFDAIRLAHSLADGGDVDSAGALAGRALSHFASLGLLASVGEEALDAATAQMVAARDAARAGRDFARADAIRHELERAGFVVEDTPLGTRIHR